jgi:hypothetical protein
MLTTMLTLLFGASLLLLLLLSAARMASACWTQKLAAQDAAATDPTHVLDFPLTLGVVFAALLITLATLLGSLGRLDSPLALAAGVPLAFLASRMVKGSNGRGRSRPGLREAGGRLLTEARSHPLRTAMAALAAASALLFLQQAGTPPTSWDALTYHLTYPAHWLHSGRLDTLYQPMGDPSSTYYPLCVEQLYFWGLRVTGSDWWAAGAQIPAALLGALAVVGLGRCLGRSIPLSLWGGLLWISTPVLLRQTFNADTDVWFAAWILVAAYFAMRFGSSGRGVHLGLGLLAGGIVVGTKYTGLVFLPVLSGVLVYGWRRRAGRRGGIPWIALLLGIGGALTVGCHAYVRNLMNGGNPLFPMKVSLGGWTLFPGMLDSRYYFQGHEQRLGFAAFLASPRAFLDCGLNLLVTILALAVAVPSVFKRPHGRPDRVLATAAIAAALLFFAAIPYRQHRFFLPIIGLSTPLLISRGRNDRLLLAIVLVNVACALAYIFKDIVMLGFGAFSMGGAVGLAIVLVSSGALAWWRRMVPTGRSGRRLIPAVALFLGVVALAAGQRGYERGRFAAWERFWSHRVEAGHGFRARVDWADWAEGWREVADITRPAPTVIAYAGNNIPYPLFGEGLRNSVLFIPATEECTSDRYDWGSTPCDLRRPGASNTWFARLRARNVHYLCVFRGLGEGWPPEWHWARAAGSDLTPIRQSTYCAIFSR